MRFTRIVFRAARMFLVAEAEGTSTDARTLEIVLTKTRRLRLRPRRDPARPSLR